MSSFFPYDDARTLLLAAELVPADHIHFANDGSFLQPQDANWLSVEAYSNILDPVDIGANVWEERGTVTIYCIGQPGTGTDSLRVLAKNVANVFRGLPARNPFYLNASIGLGGMTEGNDGYTIPVAVNFCYQDISG